MFDEDQVNIRSLVFRAGPEKNITSFDSILSKHSIVYPPGQILIPILTNTDYL